jgi:hypothetical protein
LGGEFLATFITPPILGCDGLGDQSGANFLLKKDKSGAVI